MQVYNDFLHKSEQETAVALGMFDGVHLGHRQVIGEAIKAPLKTVVMTFTTAHKRPIKKAEQKDILTTSGRLKILEEMGVKAVYMPDFDDICMLSPDAFVTDILSGKLRAKLICCGEDFRFGKNARGDVLLLRRLCGELGIKLVITPYVMFGDRAVSSTRIRKCILAGDIVTANKLLGYNYFIEGKVIYGKQIGRTISCPTINQELCENVCVPKYGVYVSTTEVDSVTYPSITNVGKKPTIKGERKPLSETHVIGIDKDLYGRTLRVTLYKFIRSEEKFDSMAELSSHIHRDIEMAKVFFEE